MNTSCREFDLIRQSQCAGWAEGVAQRRTVQFCSAQPAAKPNGAQVTEKVPSEIAVRPGTERQAAVILPGVGEELAYALLWSRM
jgi:hypothetical protein